jgi:hypothetical protein
MNSKMLVTPPIMKSSDKEWNLSRMRQGAINPKVGGTLRLLDVHVFSDDDDPQPVIVTLTTFSEAYRR